MFVQPFYFCKLLCLLNWIWWLLFLFSGDYNNRLRERYGDDILTHPEFDPDLWMEVGSSGGPGKNRVYGLSNTTADNLRTTRSVSTCGAPNQYRAPNLRSSWPCNNAQLISPKNTTTYQRSTHNSKRLMHNKERSLHNKKWLMNSFAKWSWTWQHRVEHVRLILFSRITTSLLLQDLLLLLQLHLYINL